MKKCNRCDKVFDLEQDFCPSCGSFDFVKTNSYDNVNVDDGKVKTSASIIGVLLVLFFFISLSSVFLLISDGSKTTNIILLVWFFVFLVAMIKILISLILDKRRKKGDNSEKM